MIKRLIAGVLFSALAAIHAAGQNRFPPINLVAGDPTGTACSPNSLVQSSTSGILYTCQAGAYRMPGGTSIPPTMVTWPPSCTTGVYAPVTNTCVAQGTAANPAGSDGQVQINSSGIFGADAGYSYDVPSHSLNVPAAVHTGMPIADVTSPLYGAKGDSIHDDGAAVDSATRAIVAAGGGTIYFPKGTYNLATPHGFSGAVFSFINSDHVHVVCEDGAVLKTTSTATLFYIGPANRTDPTYVTDKFPVNVLQWPYYFVNVIPLPGSPTITLTTPADTANFAVGDPIYLYGGPGTESNYDGEINWVTAIDSVGGVLTLRYPTSKPYTGNVGPSTPGPTPGPADPRYGLVTVSNGRNQFWKDFSIEGCTAEINGDFAFVGQTVGPVKILRNHVTITPGSAKGLVFNSFYPLADVEVAGNTWTLAGNVFTQLADGMREINIHDNVVSAPYCTNGGLLSISQGTINTSVHDNIFYHTVPSGCALSIYGTIYFSTGYNINLDHNQIYLTNLSATNNLPAIWTGLSNGSCLFCTIRNNLIRVTGAGASAVGVGMYVYGTDALVTGNKIHINHGNAGIIAGRRGVGVYSPALISDNQITMTNTATNTIGIYVPGVTTDPPYQAQTVVSNNFIRYDPGALGTAIVFSAAGGGQVSNNYISGAPTAISTTGIGGGATNGSPLITGNTCSNVVNTAGCNVITGDLGAQKFTGTVTMAALATPVVATPVVITTGGTLADTTQYCYTVQARNALGYSAVSVERCVTTGATGGTSSILVNWGAVPGATSYAIYGRSIGAEAHMSPDLNFTNTTFVDTNSIAPSGATQAVMTPPPIVLGSSTANLYSTTTGIIKTDGTFDASTTIATKNVCLADGTNCPGISAVTTCSIPGCVEQMLPNNSAAFTGIGGVKGVLGTCTLTTGLPSAASPYTMAICTGVTTAWQAGWISGSVWSRYYASHFPLLKFVAGFSSTADYTTNARIQMGLISSSCASATLLASDTPACSYAIIRSSTTAGDATYQCVTDTGSGAPNVVAITGATPTTTATVMSVSFGAGGVTCSVGANSALSTTKIPTGTLYDIYANSGTASNATHLQLGGILGLHQN